MTYYHPTRYPVTVGLLRSCRWQLRTRHLAVTLVYGMFWLVWVSVALCIVLFSWPVEAIAGRGKAPRAPTIRQPCSSAAAMLNARANLFRAQTQAARSRPTWYPHCRRYSPGSAVECEHCGAGGLRYYGA